MSESEHSNVSVYSFLQNRIASLQMSHTHTQLIPIEFTVASGIWIDFGVPMVIYNEQYSTHRVYTRALTYKHAECWESLTGHTMLREIMAHMLLRYAIHTHKHTRTHSVDKNRYDSHSNFHMKCSDVNTLQHFSM